MNEECDFLYRAALSMMEVDMRGENQIQALKRFIERFNRQFEGAEDEELESVTLEKNIDDEYISKKRNDLIFTLYDPINDIEEEKPKTLQKPLYLNKTKKDDEKKERIRTLLEARKKTVTLEEMNEARKSISKLYRHKMVEEEKEPSMREQKIALRAKVKEFSQQIKEENKEMPKKQPDPQKPQPEAISADYPPDYDELVKNEISVLTAADESIRELTESIPGYNETRPMGLIEKLEENDFHIAYALLFQRLENIEEDLNGINL